MVKDHPAIDQTIFFDTIIKPHPWLQLFKTVRKEKFDIAIISNPHKVFHLISFLAHIPVRIGHNKKWPFLLTNRLTLDNSQKHEIDRNLDLIDLIHPPHHTAPAKSDIHLPVSDASRTKIDIFLKKHHSLHQKIIVVSPFTTNPKKEWPANHMHDLLQRLSGENYLVLLIGSPSEETKMASLLNGITKNSIINTCRHFFLEDLPALFEKTDLLISNDSGPVHIASAFAVKMVVLYGQEDSGSNPHRWGPRKKGRLIVKVRVADITVDDVWKEIQSSF